MHSPCVLPAEFARKHTKVALKRFRKIRFIPKAAMLGNLADAQICFPEKLFRLLAAHVIKVRHKSVARIFTEFAGKIALIYANKPRNVRKRDILAKGSPNKFNCRLYV